MIAVDRARTRAALAIGVLAAAAAAGVAHGTATASPPVSLVADRGVAHRAHQIGARLRDALEVGVAPTGCTVTTCPYLSIPVHTCPVSPEFRALRAVLAPKLGAAP